MDEQAQPSKQQLQSAHEASKRLLGVLNAGIFPGEISREVSEARIFAGAMIQDGEQRLKAFELKEVPQDDGRLREDAPNGES